MTATPLLDVQVAPGLRYFAGLQSVTVYDYNAADIALPHYMRHYPKLTESSVQCQGKRDACPGLVAITALNCSGAEGCRFSGLTMISASGECQTAVGKDSALHACMHATHMLESHSESTVVA